MPALFRTSYKQDLSLFPHGVAWHIALLAVVLLLPLVVGEFYVGELAGVFIYAIAGVGVMIMLGYTGLISLGHAALLGIGAYTNAVLLSYGLPFALSLPIAGLLTGMVGVAIALPTLRMSGLYFAIATLAFGSIVVAVFSKWDSVTGGFDGFPVPPTSILGLNLGTSLGIYYVALFVLILSIWITANILRSPLGRALVAIRDSEISAQSMGINLALYKTISFAVSAFLTGLAGALFAHYVRYLAPDSFDILLSIQLVMMVIVGGLGSIQGAVFGALFIRLLPQGIALVRDDLPFNIGHVPGLEPALFGVILVLVILFEPAGINGRWFRIKAWLEDFPLHRQSTSRRQRTYTKTERLR